MNYINSMESSAMNCTDVNIVLQEKGQDLTTYTPTMVIFGALYSAIFVAGFSGNLLVVFAIAKDPTLQTVRNFFIFGLSCSDLVNCFSSVMITPIMAFIKEWKLGNAACHIIPQLQGMSLCFSTFTLTCIAVDRYILILHPQRQPISKCCCARILIAICGLAALAAFPTAFYQTLSPYKTYGVQLCGVFCMETWPSNLLRKVYGLSLLIASYFAPFSIIGVSYVKIGRKLYLRTAERIIRNEEASVLLDSHLRSEIQHRTRQYRKNQIRTNRMLIMMVSIFGVCWLPYVLQNVSRDLGLMPYFVVRQEGFFQLVVHCTALSCTVWNPILYTFMNDQFRNAFAQIFHTIRAAATCANFCGSSDIIMETNDVWAGASSPGENRRVSVQKSKPYQQTVLCTESKLRSQRKVVLILKNEDAEECKNVAETNLRNKHDTSSTYVCKRD